MPSFVACPICGKLVRPADINAHLDAGCSTHVVADGDVDTDSAGGAGAGSGNGNGNGAKRSSQPPSSPSLGSSQQPQPKRTASTFFQTPAAKRQQQTSTAPNGSGTKKGSAAATPQNGTHASIFSLPIASQAPGGGGSKKRSYEEGPGHSSPIDSGDRKNGSGRNGTAQSAQSAQQQPQDGSARTGGPQAKRSRTSKSAPLAERMRPRSLDDVCGQDLVGPHGVLRALIETDRVPSMILWGGSGTGKTTIARCIANRVGSRFVEMNATSSGGVAECKKIFQEAANELTLTGRKTILFCDEIHRFTKAQQDVFLKPVESGTITLIGATTENPSFRVVNALLSRCRTFTLAALAKEDVQRILARAVYEETGVRLSAAADEQKEAPTSATATAAAEAEAAADGDAGSAKLSPLIDSELLSYLAAFSDGDARTALNLLELAMSIAARPKELAAAAEAASTSTSTAQGNGNGAAPPVAPTSLTKEDLKAQLTKTLVYDRAGDQHYDTISAFHKSVRGSDPDATLYYLARMLQSGEDPLFVARRMVVIASEDVGLADSTLLPLATAAYTATQQIGMPEARIPLAHCAVALALAPKSTRAYRGLNNAFAVLREPGVASLPIPIHLRNAPTRLMKDMGYGQEYKYNPNYVDGRVKQEYLPDDLQGRTFLEERHLGTAVDPDL